MAITRTILNWEHDFRTATARVYVRIADDVEGTDVVRMVEYPASVLPAALATWEANVAASKNAVLATPVTPPV